MNILKQSTAATIKLGPFIDDGDGKSAETGLTISQADIRLSKNGGDFAQKNNATGATHDEFGYYDIPLNTTDTGTLGRLRVAVSESGALPVWQDFLVVTANVYDTLCSTDKLDVAAVELKSTQGAITWGQQKIVANVAGEGALDIENTSTGGLGGVGIRAEGEFAGQYNAGSQTLTSAGQYNTGVFGVWNNGDSTGQLNEGGSIAVSGYAPELALEATLTAIKGVGWTNQTLVKIITDISNISAGSGATPQQIWEYATRVLTAGTNITIPTAADVADAVWDEAISGHTTATTFGGKNQKVVPSETVGDYKADVSSLATAASLTTVDNKVGTIDGIVDAIKLKTDTIPASPAEAGEYTAAIAAVKSVADDILVDTGTTLDGKLNTIDTNVDSILADTGTDGVKIASGEFSTVATASSITALDGKIDTIDNFLDTEVAAILADTNELQAELADGGRTDLLIDAIKAKTDVIPASPAPANEYDARMTAIQADLDNPTQYKADVSGLATQTSVNAIPTSPLLAANYTAPDNASIAAIKAKTDNLPTSPAPANEYDARMTAIQAELDNPDQYKADVSALATTAHVQEVEDKVDTADTVADAIKLKTDLIPATPAQAGEYTVAIAALQADLDNPAQYKADVSGLAPANEYDAQLSVIQADLDNPAQYRADVSGLATQESVNAIPTTPLLAANYTAPDNAGIGAIKTKTDQLTFTTLNKVDASATIDPTGIATSEELEIIGEKVDNVLDKLNVSSVEFVTSVVGSTITILRGDTLTASLLNLGSMESYVSLDFTVKASMHQSDDDAVIRIRKNASGLTDGLLRLNGAAHTTGTDGSITINDAPTGDITIMLKAGVTDDLVPGTYVYDIQLIEANEVSTLTTGTLIVSADVTRLVA